jgi:hypothetical protein
MFKVSYTWIKESEWTRERVEGRKKIGNPKKGCPKIFFVARYQWVDSIDGSPLAFVVGWKFSTSCKFWNCGGVYFVYVFETRYIVVLRGLGVQVL